MILSRVFFGRGHRRSFFAATLAPEPLGGNRGSAHLQSKRKNGTRFPRNDHNKDNRTPINITRS
jgi:hypothetical protein